MRFWWQERFNVSADEGSARDDDVAHDHAHVPGGIGSHVPHITRRLLSAAALALVLFSAVFVAYPDAIARTLATMIQPVALHFAEADTSSPQRHKRVRLIKGPRNRLAGARGPHAPDGVRRRLVGATGPDDTLRMYSPSPPDPNLFAMAPPHAADLGNLGNLYRLPPDRQYALASQQIPMVDHIPLTVLGPSAVPEPSTWLMLVLGIALTGIALRARPVAKARDASDQGVTG